MPAPVVQYAVAGAGPTPHFWYSVEKNFFPGPTRTTSLNEPTEVVSVGFLELYFPGIFFPKPIPSWNGAGPAFQGCEISRLRDLRIQSKPGRIQAATVCAE